MEGRRHLGYAAGRHPPARGDLARRARAEPVRAVRRTVTTTLTQLHQSVRATQRRCTIFQNTIGNPDLQPGDRAQHRDRRRPSRPRWLPGLSVSFDYYRIKLNGVISTLSARPDRATSASNGIQDLLRRLQPRQPERDANFVNVQPFNLASSRPAVSTSKRAISGKAARPSGQLYHPGARHAYPGLPGRCGHAGRDVVDNAGVNTGATPIWKWLATQSYDNDRFTLHLQERWFSDGVFGNQYVVCSADCPVSTGNHPTIDRNYMPGALYFDVGGSYNVTTNSRPISRSTICSTAIRRRRRRPTPGSTSTRRSTTRSGASTGRRPLQLLVAAHLPWVTRPGPTAGTLFFWSKRVMYQRLIGACAAFLMALGAAQPRLASQSVYASAPDEPGAIKVAGAGDGRADDSAALQRAIDKAADKGGGGIVFLPEGTWRISRTIYLWPGVRIFGIGAKRPVILLGANTPGFQRGVAHMLIFAGARPGGNPEQRRPSHSRWPAASRSTRTCPMPIRAPSIPARQYRLPHPRRATSGDRDPVPRRPTQLCQPCRFRHRLRSGGSLSRRQRGRGSAFPRRTLWHSGREDSPAWPFALVDSTFEGQRDAAIREHEAGLTLVNVAFRNVPVGIEIDRGYGDWLWGQECVSRMSGRPRGDLQRE